MVRFNGSRAAFDIDVLALRFATAHVPIPRVLEVGETDSRFYAVSERAFGTFLEDLAPAEMEAALPSVLEMLDALQAADTSGSVGFGPWDLVGNSRYRSWSEYLLDVESEASDDLRAGWRENLARSPTAERAWHQGAGELKELADLCPDERSLVHSDLLNRNVFVAGGRVAALIDWQCAMYDDHLYDLAWFTFWAPWHPGVAAVDLRTRALERHRVHGLDVTGFDSRIRCYELHIGLRHLVYNAWRNDLANLEGTARRTLDVLG